MEDAMNAPNSLTYADVEQFAEECRQGLAPIARRQFEVEENEVHARADVEAHLLASTALLFAVEGGADRDKCQVAYSQLYFEEYAEMLNEISGEAIADASPELRRLFEADPDDGMPVEEWIVAVEAAHRKAIN
jgi:hypothetical protein